MKEMEIARIKTNSQRFASPVLRATHRREKCVMFVRFSIRELKFLFLNRGAGGGRYRQFGWSGSLKHHLHRRHLLQFQTGCDAGLASPLVKVDANPGLDSNLDSQHRRVAVIQLPCHAPAYQEQHSILLFCAFFIQAHHTQAYAQAVCVADWPDVISRTEMHNVFYLDPTMNFASERFS